MERLDVTRTGLPGIPEVPWGTHLCLFYQTGEDLVEVLVPYGLAGVESGEAVLLMARDPATRRELEDRLRLAIPDFDRRAAEGAIELVGPDDGYLAAGKFDGETATAYWRAKQSVAAQRGFNGMRANGDESWLRPDDWDVFQRYENGLTAAIAGERVMLLCAYALDERSGAEAFEVVHAHQMVLAKREGKWEALEAAEVGQTSRQLQAVRAELEWRVLLRTEELSRANERLRKEIAERTRAERALRESEGRFRTVFEESPLITAITRLDDTRLIDVNPAFLRTFGFERAGVTGRTATELGLWADERERDRVYATIRESGSIHGYNVRLRAKTGRILDMVASAVVAEVDGLPCSLWVAMDVTARRRAEVALIEQQWLLNESERLTSTGSWRWSATTGKVVWSRELYRIHGQEPGLFSPSYDSWLDLVHPEDRAACAAAIDAARKGAGSFALEHRIVRPDGSLRVLRSVGYSRHEEGEHVIGYATDVTDRREAERSVRTAAEQVTAMSRKLVELQESERRKLASDLHDRIGQNLTAIGLNLDIVASALESMEGMANGGAVLARLEDSSALLESTADAVADVAAELRPPMLDDLGLMSALRWYARGFTSRTGIHVELRAPEGTPRPPPPHELAVFRIVQEALTNVAKHAGAQNVDIAFEHLEGECRYSICDDGIGPQDTRTGRADQGLGLITMRERAVAIGGSFRFGARDRGGSCVEVRVPYTG